MKTVVFGVALSLAALLGVSAQETGVATTQYQASTANTGVFGSLKLDSRPGRIQRFDKSAGGVGEATANDGTIYAVKLSKEIHAIRIADGKPLWKQRSNSPVIGLSFFRSDDADLLIASTYTGATAYDRKSGRLAWSRYIKHGLAGGVVVGNRFFAGGYDGSAYCLDTNGGNVIWKTDYMQDAPDSSKGEKGDRARLGDRPSRPRVASSDGTTVFFSVFDQCRVIAFDCESGECRWSFETDGWMFGRPTITKDHVFVGSQDDQFYCINKADGSLTWKFKTRARIEASCAVTDTHVYFGSCDANLYCAEIETGELKWKFATQKRARNGGPIYEQPIVSGNTVVLAAMEGQVYGLDLLTGMERWKMRPSNKSEIDGCFTDGERLFVTTRLNSDDEGEDALYTLSP